MSTEEEAPPPTSAAPAPSPTPTSPPEPGAPSEPAPAPPDAAIDAPPAVTDAPPAVSDAPLAVTARADAEDVTPAGNPRRANRLAFLLLLLLGVYFRVPALFNVDAVNSDTAVVGLQALHILRGEHNRVLWGTGYQGVVEPLVTAAVYKLTGTSLPMAMALSGLLGYLLLLVSLYGVSRRWLRPPLAFAAAALLLFAPEPLNLLTYSPPRIWAFGLLAAGIWGLDHGLGERKLWSSILGGALIGLGYYSDLFVTMLLPGIVLFGLVRFLERDRRLWGLLCSVLAVGGFFGGGAFAWTAAMRGPGAGELSRAHFPRAWSLFITDCFPFALGFQVRVTPDGYTRTPQPFELWQTVIAALGAAGMVAIVLAALLVVFRRPTERHGGRAFALLGGSWIGVALIGFLFTGRAMDFQSARYLNPIVLAFPWLGMAVLQLPFAKVRKVLTVCVAAVALHFGIAGWLSYGPWTAGPFARTDAASSGEEERTLFQELKARGVSKAVSEYWVSYKLMAIWAEELIVTTTYGERYWPHREGLHDPGMRAIILMDGITPQFYERWRAIEGVEEVVSGRYHAFVMPTAKLEEGMFRTEFTPAKAEVTVTPGETIEMDVKVKNAGAFPFRHESYRVGMNLKNPDGSLKAGDTGGPGIGWLDPGQETTVKISRAAPNEPGTYVLELDVVKEFWWWFHQRGNPVGKVNVVVVASTWQ